MQGNATLLAVALLFAAQLVVFLLVARVRNAAASAGGDVAGDPDEYVDGDTVVCPQCGTTNDLGYRFCAECVGELPRPVSFERRSSIPFTRGIR